VIAGQPAQASRDPFADLNSDLDGQARPGQPIEAEDMIEHAEQYSARTGRSSSAQRVPVACPKCRGSGTWGFSNYRGPLSCFGCKGTGKVLRAPGYEIAKAQRAKAAARKALEAAQALEANRAAISAAHPAEIASLAAYRAQSRYRSDFMDSLASQFARTGHLSTGQLEALTRGIEKQKERALAQDGAPLVILARIEKFSRVDNLALHLGACKVVQFGSGAVAVVAPDFGGGTFAIIEHGGKLRRMRGLTDEMLALLLEVEKDGIEAVKRIGRATGRCCVCARKLTDENSIEAGIGPICAERASAFTCTEV